MHVFLSPHLDDVILSCGATVARLRRQGEHVLILTVMSGEPPEALPDTPILRALRETMEGVNKAVLTRRHEDEQAAKCLGVQVMHLALLESSYRTVRSLDGEVALYPSDDSTHGKVHPDDDARITLLTMPLPIEGEVTAIYAPLAAGNHVDHQLVREWALVLTGRDTPRLLRFYGEYPYVLNPSVVALTLHELDEQLAGLKPIEERSYLDGDEVEMKMAALRCYTSDMHVTWKTLTEMENAVRAWMDETGAGQPAERLWRLVKQTDQLSMH